MAYVRVMLTLSRRHLGIIDTEAARLALGRSDLIRRMIDDRLPPPPADPRMKKAER